MRNALPGSDTKPARPSNSPNRRPTTDATAARLPQATTRRPRTAERLLHSGGKIWSHEREPAISLALPAFLRETVVRAPLCAAILIGRRGNALLVDVEGYPERDAKPLLRWGVKFSSQPAKYTLREREEVVAVDDAVARKPLLDAKRHLSRETTNGSGYRSDGHVGEHRYCPVASHDHDRASASWQVDVADLAPIHSGSPPSARSNASRAPSPISPTHSS